MYIRGLIPRIFAELAKAVPIEKRLARNNVIFLWWITILFELHWRS